MKIKFMIFHGFLNEINLLCKGVDEIMTNKWPAIIAASILALGLTACSDGVNNDKDISQEANTEQENTNNEEEQNNAGENIDDTNQSTDEIPDDDEEISEEDRSIVALVNKQYSLGEDYAPEDLVTVDVPTILENPEVNQLRKVAADALKEMFDQAEEAGIYLHARSGYRSYQTQVQLFQGYADQHGEEAANRYSAKPGHSEHQTGLVMDVTSESVNYQLTESFGETEEGKWLSEHAHEFGFIIRYPEGAEDITGYIYEPWHIRYLGVNMATKVYESGLTYEEYLEEEGLIHEVNSSS